MNKPMRFAWIATLGLTTIAGFFSGVAMRALGLFHLVTYHWPELWDWSFPPTKSLRLGALNDFAVAASVVIITAFVLHYVVRPTVIQQITATILWISLIGWFTVA